MAHISPRRAMRVPRRVRLTALAIPVVLVGGATSAGAVAAWPDAPALTAVPAPAGQALAPGLAARDDVAERASRRRATERSELNQGQVDPDRGATQAPKAATQAPKAAIQAPKAAIQAPKAAAPAPKPSAKQTQAAKAPSGSDTDTNAGDTKRSNKADTPRAADIEVTGQRYTRVRLNVRAEPTNSADLVTVLGRGAKLNVTDKTKGSWTLVLHRGKGRWVHSEYLTRTKPQPVVAAQGKKDAGSSAGSKSSASGDANEQDSGDGGLSSKPCPSGSSMESGLTSDAIAVHRAICAKFPSITSYGGMRAGGGSYHSSGRAVDVMTPNTSIGWKIANWVRANRKSLGVSEIIFAQRIWTVQRGGEGWRPMSDRGSVSANHFDHVHVSVYGSAGTS